MQKPIYLYDSGGVLSATITEVIDAGLAERLDGTLTLYFASKVARLPVVTPETLIEFDGQYYRAMQIQSGISGGEFSLSVSCEQESITLVDYAIEEEFAFVGPANDALARLLDGTGITATAEYDGEIAVNVSGGNRRSVLLEIAALCGGEIEYHGHHIRIVNRRGTGAAYIAVLGSNTLTTHTATGRVYGNLYKTYTVNPDTGEIVCSDYLSATLTGEVIYNNYKNYPVYKDSTGKVHYINSVTKLASGSYRRTSQTITATRRTKELPSEEIHVSDIAVNTDPRSGTVSYDITISDPDKVSVGDDVELNFAPLRLTGSQRIVGKRYNPFNCTAVYLEVGEYSQTITSDYSDMQQIFLRKADAKMEFESYINSAEGIAAVKGALSGEFVTQDALTGFVTESQLNVAVEAYINGEEGIASLTQALTGTFVSVREYGNNITLTASSQMFVQAEGSDGYSPSSITLTANTDGDLTFAWYKDGTVLSGKTSKTLTVYPAEITGNSATYRVVGTDADNKTYSDQMTIAKLREGKEGANGADGYTVVLSNEYSEIPVTYDRKPKNSGTKLCSIEVYSGTSQLNAVTGTPAEGQFRVVIESENPSGMTVLQTEAGNIQITYSNQTAINDLSEIYLTIEIYGGLAVPAKITLVANMNDVAAGAYKVTSNIGQYIKSYITENSGEVSDALSGEFVTADALTGYAKTTEVEASITRQVDAFGASLVLTAQETTVDEHVPTDEMTGDFWLLNFDNYINLFSFELVDGWYVSQNAGVADSASIGVIEFNFSKETVIALQCVNNAESGYDYGYVSEVDREFTTDTEPDDSGIFYTFINQHSDDVVTLLMTIPSGSHTVSVKYVKDGSGDHNADCFKVRAVTTEAVSTSSGSKLELKSNGTVLSSANITFKGYVTFESLSTPGATTIDGANISTENLRVENVFLGGDNSRKIITSELDSRGGTVDIGFIEDYGPSSYGKVVKIYADYLYVVPPGGSELDDEVLIISPKSMYFGANSNNWTFDT